LYPVYKKISTKHFLVKEHVMFENKLSMTKVVFYGLWFVTLFVLTAWFSAKAYAATTSAKEASLKPITQTKQSGLTASVNKITTDKAKTDVISCIDLPSNADWLPHVVLYDDTAAVPMTELSLIDAKKPETSAASHRCYHFVFHKGLSGKSAKIVIEKVLPRKCANRRRKKFGKITQTLHFPVISAAMVLVIRLKKCQRIWMMPKPIA
jgi:hypothetical protein